MVLVTGMIIGTIFTLFVVPVFYSLLAANHAPAYAADAFEGRADDREYANLGEPIAAFGD
jgi:multidrug efflux pump